jgi:hypothetical protein
VKELLLAGTLLIGSWIDQGRGILQVDPTQLFEQLQQEIIHDLRTLGLTTGSEKQNVIANEQINELIHQFNQAYDAGVKSRLRHHQLQAPRTKQSVQTNQIEISAGDESISTGVINQTSKLIEGVSIPILEQSVGTPTDTIHVVLFSSSSSYANALTNAGMARSEVKKFIKGTQGLTVDNEIWIPLYNLSDKSELDNVLTHELTHAILNQRGIGDTIPVWVNEGLAWHNGMLAKMKVNPTKTKQLEAMLNNQIQTVANSGKLLPLTASEEDIVSASYTVEWVDYLAVQNLIDQNGMDSFLSFLNGISKNGVEASFQTEFGQSIATYEQDFYQQLN